MPSFQTGLYLYGSSRIALFHLPCTYVENMVCLEHNMTWTRHFQYLQYMSSLPILNYCIGNMGLRVITGTGSARLDKELCIADWRDAFDLHVHHFTKIILQGIGVGVLPILKLTWLEEFKLKAESSKSFLYEYIRASVSIKLYGHTAFFRVLAEEP